MDQQPTYFAPEGGFKIGDRFFQAGEIIPHEHFNAAPLHVQNALRLAGGAQKLKSMVKQTGLFGGEFLPTQEKAALKAGPKPVVHPEEKQGELFDDMHLPAHMPLFDQQPSHLHEARGDNGMVARVYPHAKGFSVSLHDEEAGETLPSVRIYPDLERAKAHADSIVPKAAPPGPPVQKSLFSIGDSLKESGNKLQRMLDFPKETSPAPEPAAPAPEPVAAPAATEAAPTSHQDQTDWHPVIHENKAFLEKAALRIGIPSSSQNQEEAMHEGRVAMQNVLNANPNAETPFLRSTAKNAMVDHLRKINKINRRETGVKTVQASQVEPSEVNKAYNDASMPKQSDMGQPSHDEFLQHLSDPTLHSIIKLELQGHSINSIAQQLGMSPKQVHNQRRTAVIHMRNGMKNRQQFSVSPDERYGIWSNMKAFGGKVMDKVEGAATGLGNFVNQAQDDFERVSQHPVAQKIDRGIDAVAGKVRGMFGGQSAPKVQSAAKIPNPAQVVRDQGVNSAFTASAKVPDQARRQMRGSREGLVNPIGAQPATGGPAQPQQPQQPKPATTGHEKMVVGPRTFQVHMREPITAHHDQFVGESHGDFVSSKRSGSVYLRYNGHLYPVEHQEVAVNFVDGKLKNSDAIRSRIHAAHQQAGPYPPNQVPKGVQPTPGQPRPSPAPAQASPAPAPQSAAPAPVGNDPWSRLMKQPPPAPVQAQVVQRPQSQYPPNQVVQTGPPPVQQQPPSQQQRPPAAGLRAEPSPLDNKPQGSLFTGRELGLAHYPRDPAERQQSGQPGQSSASGPPAASPAAPAAPAAAKGPGFGQQLKRNLKFGQNNVSVQFENEKHRDLYDWYANRKFQPTGRAGARVNRPDNSAELMAKHGIPQDQFLVEAAKVWDHTKAQMKGMRDGEHRDLKMSPTGQQNPPAPVPAEPIKVPLDGAGHQNLDMTNPLNHALVRVHGFHPGRVLMMSDDQKRRMLQTIGENQEIQANAPPPSPARQQAMEKQAAAGNTAAQRAVAQQPAPAATIQQDAVHVQHPQPAAQPANPRQGPERDAAVDRGVNIVKKVGGDPARGANTAWANLSEQQQAQFSGPRDFAAEIAKKFQERHSAPIRKETSPAPEPSQSIGNTTDEWSPQEKALIDAVHKWRPKTEAMNPGSAPGGGRVGKNTDIHVVGWRNPVPSRYEVMELKDLQASHDYWNGSSRSNPNFPPGIQTRDYRPGTVDNQKVIDNAAARLPDYFNSEHPDATNGPPTLSAENIVLNGNGRVHTLQLSAGKGDYDWIKNDLINKAHQFGLDQEQVRGMQHPVLVRKTNLPSDSQLAREFAKDGNLATTFGQNRHRQAESMKHMIDDVLLSNIRLEGDETMSDFWAREKHPIMQEFRKNLPMTMQAEIFSPGGMLTPKGKELVGDILLAKVLPVETLEKTASNQASLLRAIEGSVPQLLAMKQHFDVTGAMSEAVDFLNANPEIVNNALLDESQRQLGLFEKYGKDLSPRGTMLGEFLLNHRGKERYGVNGIRTALKKVLEAIKFRGGLFGADSTEPEHEEIARLLGVKPREGAKFRYSAWLDLLIERFNASREYVDKSRVSATLPVKPRTPSAETKIKLRYSNGIRQARHVVSR